MACPLRNADGDDVGTRRDGGAVTGEARAERERPPQCAPRLRVGRLCRHPLDDRARQGESLPDTILTPREEEVLKLVAEGYSSREIANTLGISVKTVDRHRTNTLAKLGLRDRLALTRYAIRAGLIEP